MCLADLHRHSSNQHHWRRRLKDIFGQGMLRACASHGGPLRRGHGEGEGQQNGQESISVNSLTRAMPCKQKKEHCGARNKRGVKQVQRSPGQPSIFFELELRGMAGKSQKSKARADQNA